jgi:hypothetical protein
MSFSQRRQALKKRRIAPARLEAPVDASAVGCPSFCLFTRVFLSSRSYSATAPKCFGLDSRQAAVDRQVDTGDVAALVSGEEQSCGSDFLGTRQARQRRHRHDLLSGFGSAVLGRELLVEHQRVDRARAQHVGPDLPILEFAGPRPGERPERCLGGAVGAAARQAFVLPSGRHEDDRSAIIQVGQRLLNGRRPSLITMLTRTTGVGRRLGAQRPIP